MPDKKPPKDSKFGNFFQNEPGNLGYSMVAWSWSCRPQWGGGLQQMPMTSWIKCQCQGLKPLGLSLIIYHYITLIDRNRNQQSLSISVDTILHETSQVTQVLFKDLHSGRKFPVRNQKWDDTRSPITSPTVDSNEIQPMCTVFWLLPQTKPKIWWKSRLEIMR